MSRRKLITESQPGTGNSCGLKESKTASHNVLLVTVQYHIIRIIGVICFKIEGVHSSLTFARTLGVHSTKNRFLLQKYLRRLATITLFMSIFSTLKLYMEADIKLYLTIKFACR